MTSSDLIATPHQTLASRLAEGRLPVPEAFRYAILLAEALRKVHGSGKIHGAISPECIVLTDAGIDLTPAPNAPGAVTPYTAPETSEARPAGFSSDIFSFGALLYEMLTGRKAFTGESSADLAQSIATAVPTPTGVPAFDRLICGCLAKDPKARLQSTQAVLLELKLLRASARCAGAPTRPSTVEAKLRAEMQQFEARMVARLEEREKSGAAIQQATSDSLSTLRTQLASLRAELTAAQEQSAVMQDAAESARQSLSVQIQQGMDANAALERSIDSVRQRSATLEIKLGGDLLNCDTKIQEQAAALEVFRASLAASDCLMERLVDAIEMVQNIVIDTKDAL